MFCHVRFQTKFSQIGVYSLWRVLRVFLILILFRIK